MIPDEVVEAAARAIAETGTAGWVKGEWDDPDIAEKLRDETRVWAREALEAAAPHLIAHAKAEAMEDAMEWLRVPSQPRGGFVAGWLKIRAEEYRKGNL